jgi:hypothetical protein
MVTKGLLAAVLALTGVTASAGSIVGSKHDFSNTTTYPWNPSGQICVTCHAPHNTAAGLTALWNHDLSTATYTLYNNAFSSTINGTVAAPGSTSKLCLSCHDGTVALNSFGGGTGTLVYAGGTTSLGIDLTNDHPIGITYDATLISSDGALKAITTANTIGFTGKTKVGTVESNLLYNGKIECASCHDVHNTFTVPLANSGTLVSNKLVKMTMVGSALCVACHDK